MITTLVQPAASPHFADWLATLHGSPIFNVTITQPARSFWAEAGPLLAATVIGGLITLASGYFLNAFQSDEIRKDRTELWRAEVSKRQHAEVLEMRVRINRIASHSRQLWRQHWDGETRPGRKVLTSDNLDADLRELHRFAKNRLPELREPSRALHAAVASLKVEIAGMPHRATNNPFTNTTPLHSIQDLSASMVDVISEVEARFDRTERYVLDPAEFSAV